MPFDARHSEARICRRCGYRLDGLVDFRCSECGTPFDPRNPRTYRRPGQLREQTSRRIRIWSGWIMALGSMLLTVFIWPLLFFSLGAYEAGFVSTFGLAITLIIAALPFVGIPVGLTLTHEPENGGRRW